MNDYVYQLTDLGRERARRLRRALHLLRLRAGLADRLHRQRQRPIADQAASDGRRSAPRLRRPADQQADAATGSGPAINSGRGLFLFGAPGNGKTSIAERITKAFGQYIWIPRAIGVDGEIMRLFDPGNARGGAARRRQRACSTRPQIDKRWVRIRRPTIVVGGELTMDHLEVTLNTSTGISEAPLQLKSNCGTLVIDDFGRQRMSTDELLNRWIVPLEKRYDFLNLPNGKKIQVPFDQLIIFSTNLEPKDLVDDAFLRRIPYKIEVIDPTEEEFRELFKIMAPQARLRISTKRPIDYLIETHYRAVEPPVPLLPAARPAAAGPQLLPATASRRRS